MSDGERLLLGLIIGGQLGVLVALAIACALMYWDNRRKGIR